MTNKVINRQSIGYDSNKIIEKLENEKSIHNEHYIMSPYKDYPEIKERYKQTITVLNKAIEK